IAERHLIGVARYLESAVERGGDHAQPRRFVEQGRGIPEDISLFGVIVDGVEIRRRIFKPKSVPVAARGDEIFGAADAAAVVEARRERLPAAAIETDASAGRGKRSAGDVENAGSAQA